MDDISNRGMDSFETILFQFTEDLYRKCMDGLGVISLMDKARVEGLWNEFSELGSMKQWYKQVKGC